MSRISPPPKRRKRSRWLLWLFIIAIIIGGFFFFRVFGPNTGRFDKDAYLYIRTGATYDDVKRSLQEDGFIKNINSFDMLAKRAEYPQKVKAGKYKIRRGMSNYEIVRMLRSGNQEPVKLVINKLRTKQDLVTFVCTRLEADSNIMWQLLQDSIYLSQFGLDTNTAMCAIVPDTYEFFWNTSADNTYKRLAKYYKTYWTEERRQKAAAKGFTPEQIVILSSIVEEETNKNDEKGNMASVYINRIKTGMRLQADPTVRFAMNDFTIKRVGGYQLENPSPYNTYRHAGLPPGPICTPSKKTIDAVLNAPETKYIYFCAKEDFSGYHRFATNYADHMKNAKLYQKALNERNIR